MIEKMTKSEKKKIAKVYRNAAKLLSKKDAWTQKYLARPRVDSLIGCDPLDEDANSWCAVGSLVKVCNGNDTEIYDQAYEYLDAHCITSRKISSSVENWNDAKNRRKCDVVQLFNRLAKKLDV